MKKLSDYKGQNIAIHFPTYELWLRRKEINPEDDLNDWDWKNGYIYYTPFERCGKGDAYIKSPKELNKGYTILPATDFLEEEFVYGQEYEFSDYEDFRKYEKLTYISKSPNNISFISWDKENYCSEVWNYARKINTERTEAIATAKELITKFDIKQEELFNN